MANEVNVQATLTYSKYSPVVQAAAGVTFDQRSTGKAAICNIMLIDSAAAGTQLTFGDAAATSPAGQGVGYLFLKNLDPSAIDPNNQPKFVEVAIGGTAFNTGATIFCKILPQQFFLIPLYQGNTTKLWAKSTAGTGEVLVMAVEQ